MLRSSLASLVFRSRPTTKTTPLFIYQATRYTSTVLYQYHICPYCNKAKALLQYAGVEYTPVEVNPLTKAELKWSKSYRKVPIMTMGEHVYNGSDRIMDHLLETKKLKEKLALNKIDLESFNQGKEWVTFANDELASLLYPNICRTIGDSYEAFAYVNQVSNFSFIQKIMIRGLGSLAMYVAAARVKKKKNIVDEARDLEDALLKLENEGLAGKEFLSGLSGPNIGDIAVYGTLRSIQGLPAHDRFVVKRGGDLYAWYERMAQKVG